MPKIIERKATGRKDPSTLCRKRREITKAGTRGGRNVNGDQQKKRRSDGTSDPYCGVFGELSSSATEAGRASAALPKSGLNLKDLLMIE